MGGEWRRGACGRSAVVLWCRFETGTTSLAVEAHPEVEDLGVVAGGLDDGEAEVEGDGHRAEHGDGQADAEAGRDAVVGDLVGARGNSAAVEEGDEVDLVIGA